MKKNNKMRLVILVGILVVASTLFTYCKSGEGSKSRKSQKNEVLENITSNNLGNGKVLEITFHKGKSHNHPSFVFWLESLDGEYLQTLFVTKAIGQGVFEYGDKSGGSWKPGEVRRPAALPYWAHKRGILSEDGSLVPTPRSSIPDAYSGATPKGSFKLGTRSDNDLKGKVKLMFEINQTWDWNEYWNNNKYPDNMNYKTSCQPALVYSAIIDFDDLNKEILLKPIGHSHYSGEDGSLTTDLQTITSALFITKEIKVQVVDQLK